MFHELRKILTGIKTDSRASLGDERVENLLRIVLEGPPLARFNPEPAMASWAEQRIRRPRQKRGKDVTDKGEVRRRI